MAKSEQRTLLSSDGELNLGEQSEVVYCNACGTANATSAAFCRKCGHNLEEQEADMVGVAALGSRLGIGGKAKHDQEAAPVRRRNPGEDLPVQITTLVGVAAMSITAFIRDQGVAVIPILIAWMIAEIARSQSKQPIGGVNVPINVTLVCIVTALSMAALITGQGAAVILISIVWMILEIIRSQTPA
ncbi:MAG TPA: zinc ribbon domain-containing protein [Aggregatilineales bacterium]|nr:zinc ribbon domain-containing protein [Anaerolineales bacterium]HRE46681.1 zinc ribbon domain-containing protein [Aggregatilineales bacterium]